MSKFIKILIIFTLVLAAVGYGFWRSNIYSKEELKLEMIGPSEAQLGQEFKHGGSGWCSWADCSRERPRP